MSSSLKSAASTFITALSVGLSALTTAGAEKSPTRCADDAMLVFDGSGSMASMGYNGLNKPRLYDAQQAVRRVLPSVAPIRRLGLIVYGPGPRDECSNVDLRLPPTANASERILSELDSLRPAGNTPLTRAVEDAAEALNYREKSGTVVLITDGKENCGGATCRVAAKLAQAGSNITVHVIGFRVRSRNFNWQGNDTAGYENGRTRARCLADMTGGLYVSTETTDELINALRQTLACPMIGRLERG